MKKIKLIVFIYLTLASFNQSYSQKGLQIGIQSSPQMSWLINKDDLNNIEFGYRNTFNNAFGLLFQYNFENGMGLGINTMYSFQGQRYIYQHEEYYRVIEYLKVPFLYIFTYQVNYDIFFVGKVGPQIDFLMNAKLADKNGSDIVGNQRGAYEDFDIGGTAYAGLAFKISEEFFIDLALRYDYAFTDAESKGYKYNINRPLVLNGNGGNTGRNPNRTITNNSTAGINFGVRYVFK